MEQLKANNYDKAFTELSSLDQVQGQKLKETIDFAERTYFHVALIRIIDRPGEAKNEVNVNVQPFNSVAFEKILKNHSFLGINKLIILHDPREHKEEAQSPIAPNVSSSSIKSQFEIDEEIEAKAKERADQLLQEMLKGHTMEPIKTPSIIDEMDIVQLKEFAKTNEIDLSGFKKESEIREIISTWLEEQKNKQ